MIAFSLGGFLWGAVKVLGALAVLAFIGGLLTGMARGSR